MKQVPLMQLLQERQLQFLGHIIIRKSRNKWVTKYSFFRPGLGTANLSQSLNWDVLSVYNAGANQRGILAPVIEEICNLVKDRIESVREEGS